jgi:hypothetical protein
MFNNALHINNLANYVTPYVVPACTALINGGTAVFNFAPKTIGSGAIIYAIGALVNIASYFPQRAQEGLNTGANTAVRTAVDGSLSNLEAGSKIFKDKVLVPMLTKGAEIVIDIGFDTLDKVGNRVYGSVKEVVFKNPPPNAIGPVEFLQEKVNKSLPKISKYLHSKSEYLNSIKPDISISKVVIVTGIAITTGSLTYAAYKKRQELASLCKRVAHSTYENVLHPTYKHVLHPAYERAYERAHPTYESVMQKLLTRKTDTREKSDPI